MEEWSSAPIGSISRRASLASVESRPSAWTGFLSQRPGPQTRRFVGQLELQSQSRTDPKRDSERKYEISENR